MSPGLFNIFMDGALKEGMIFEGSGVGMVKDGMVRVLAMLIF